MVPKEAVGEGVAAAAAAVEEVEAAVEVHHHLGRG